MLPLQPTSSRVLETLELTEFPASSIEIIFEVLSGSGATLEPSTAVTINDSVILRISSLEEKLSQPTKEVIQNTNN